MLDLVLFYNPHDLGIIKLNKRPSRELPNLLCKEELSRYFSMTE